MLRSKTLKVVGMTFAYNGEVYPQNLYAIAEIHDARKIEAIRDMPGDELWPDDDGPQGDPIEVLLIRNPANEVDANAIEVHVPLIGRRSMVGHVPRETAERLAPRMDRGEPTTAIVDAVLIAQDNPDNPGLSIIITVDDGVDTDPKDNP